jgi:ubiquitin thioesterase protein OTUB1
VARSLTSRALEQRRDELAVFLPEGQSVADRRALAERMGEEAEQLEMSALADTLGVSVRIYQLDRSEGAFAVYTLGPPVSPTRRELTLLYRPGHYDFLYKRS